MKLMGTFPIADIARIRAVVVALKALRGEDRHAVVYDSQPLRDVAERVRKVALRDFESKEQPRFERLLAALMKDGIPLAALSVCGRGTEEIRYTQLLSYFLNPIAPHGLETRVLRAVLEPELDKRSIPFDSIDAGSTSVNAEVPLGRGSNQLQSNFLDLLIEFKIGSRPYFVLIEQKINSSEDGAVSTKQLPQLARYWEAFQGKYTEAHEENSIRLFLTPTLRKGKAGTEWQPLSHEDLVKRCVALFEEKDLSTQAVHNLRCFLWDLVLGPIMQDVKFVDDLRAKITEVLNDHKTWFAMKRWCERQGVELDTTFSIIGDQL